MHVHVRQVAVLFTSWRRRRRRLPSILRIQRTFNVSMLSAMFKCVCDACGIQDKKNTTKNNNTHRACSQCQWMSLECVLTAM